ncbi:MAG: epoxyqueuosine reductase [Anaerolineae bacterium]|nr:epoxyqueuosine reductase [Anaerolineae bacterium]
MDNQHDWAVWIKAAIAEFVAGPENILGGSFGDESAWAEPLVGFANGADPLWSLYKEVVGPFHWTPKELFDLAFPAEDVAPEALTAISWVLPQTMATKETNRMQTRVPAERWARSRVFGEQFNDKLRQHVVDALTGAGCLSVAPMLCSEWRSVDSDKYVYASTWSERHTAYAAGLGTFGLCDGLITPAGKAMRVGSVVARLSISPTPRPYTQHQEYCLFYTQGICAKCVDRCPAGALSARGHDKVKCSEYMNRVTKPYVMEHYGFDGYGCGLCQTGVPCESRIPTASDL